MRWFGPNGLVGFTDGPLRETDRQTALACFPLPPSPLASLWVKICRYAGESDARSSTPLTAWYFDDRGSDSPNQRGQGVRLGLLLAIKNPSAPQDKDPSSAFLLKKIQGLQDQVAGQGRHQNGSTSTGGAHH